MTGVVRVTDWVAAQLELVERSNPKDSVAPPAEVVRLGDNQVLIHAPRGRSFELTVREITGEVSRG
jgi:hypothetical protein